MIDRLRLIVDVAFRLRKDCFWPGTEISAIDLLAEYLPFSSVEHEQGRRNSQRQVVADCRPMTSVDLEDVSRLAGVL